MPATPQSKRLNSIFLSFKEKEKLTETAFAESLGISASSLRRMKAGDQPISQRVLFNLANKYGYSPDWLLNGTGNKRPKHKEQKTLLTAIEELRADYRLLEATNKQLHIRMQQVEIEHQALIDQLNGISKELSGTMRTMSAVLQTALNKD